MDFPTDNFQRNKQEFSICQKWSFEMFLYKGIKCIDIVGKDGKVGGLRFLPKHPSPEASCQALLPASDLVTI